MSLYEDFRHLSPTAALLARASARPRQVAFAGACILTALGAVILGFLAAENFTGTSLLQALCGASAINNNFATFGLSLATWLAMILVMMMPGAAPMLLTYAEIADTAAAKGVRAPSPLVLAGGYLAMWAVFALVASGIETVVSPQFLPGSTAAVILLSGNLILAGLFQFSSLKHACLARCRRPFAFFFANWTERAPGVFRLGLRQGVFCLGCCWALMLLMLSLGAMNLVWMAILAAIMTAEKMTGGEMLPRAMGVTLIGAGVILCAVNMLG